MRGRRQQVVGEEWRIHFHVPVFADELGMFGTTQSFLSDILTIHRTEPISSHLEVETYTWNVLPGPLRKMSVEDAIIREMNWVLDQLQ